MPVTAVALGAVMIKHFILDRSIGGPDAMFSLNRNEFAAMVRDVRLAQSALGTVDFDRGENADGRKWGRSLYVSARLPKEPLPSPTCGVRPGYSLHPRHLHDILGRRATRPYRPGDRIEFDKL